jgi:hypothetical protein
VAAFHSIDQQPPSIDSTVHNATPPRAKVINDETALYSAIQQQQQQQQWHQDNNNNGAGTTTTMALEQQWRRITTT